MLRDDENNDNDSFLLRKFWPFFISMGFGVGCCEKKKRIHQMRVTPFLLSIEKWH